VSYLKTLSEHKIVVGAYASVLELSVVRKIQRKSDYIRYS
jgi:hypothetical protein